MESWRLQPRDTQHVSGSLSHHYEVLLSIAIPAADLALMRQLVELHPEFPFAGARMLRGLLAARGSKTGRLHVKTLMRRMGIEALYWRPRTTKPEPGTRSIRICCVAWRSCVRTKSGRWTSPIFRWPRASSISRWCSTGSRGACCRGAYPSRWRPRSVSPRWRKLWPGMGGRKSSTRIKVHSSRVRPSPACLPGTASRSAWTAKAPGGITCSSSGFGGQ
jgi:hypothetical protein